MVPSFFQPMRQVDGMSVNDADSMFVTLEQKVAGITELFSKTSRSMKYAPVYASPWCMQS